MSSKTDPTNSAGQPGDEPAPSGPSHFVRDLIRSDLETGRVQSVVTRFPPEPNGYLHIGHAKSICLNFGMAAEFGGKCNLRLDDTNPVKEDEEYIEAIEEDLRWLGVGWGGETLYASDYFEKLYGWAEHLINAGNAYVDDLSAEQIREYRGTLTAPGRNSPHRERAVEENLDLFRRMRAGDFEDGSRVLRAKIDMASGNINLRDPVLYRVLRTPHPRTGDTWCIYPTYDFAHGQSDAIEGITHSLCTLEFADHRPLYDWLIENLPTPSKPQQTEFARLNMTHTMLSKRKLNQLVTEGHVRGWDDPRMPTLRGLRRRGVPADAIRDFASRIGVARADSMVEYEFLEACIRENLNKTASRRMAVLNPLKVVIENYPEGQTEELEAVNNPEDPADGTRMVGFSRELYIERDDFMEAPPKKFFRLAPGREVRLRYAYYVTCTDVIKNDAGEVVEIRCSYDPATRGGDSPDGRKVKGTIHWVSASHARRAEIRKFQHLFASETAAGDDLAASLNADSLTVVDGAWVEPALVNADVGRAVQFERLGYFCLDPDSTDDLPVFNQVVSLKDTWKKIQKAA
ncbi:MAG: glutamine--tRNA ligase/YqeY domain fusion protein [Hyphomicrobiales bacterium]|nr:glutamine--tRNA ligase/YqeY domain fusion protein [Hyphomicrobiales bacterium]